MTCHRLRNRGIQAGETPAALKASAAGKWLVGIRHLLHLEADLGWLLRPDARRGLAAVARSGLVSDLVGNTSHLLAMLRTVADFPPAIAAYGLPDFQT